jgi:ferredoxin-like protein FixX
MVNVMSIDTTGKWWVGTNPTDIREYLIAYTQDAYSVSEFRLAKCSCGSDVFSLEADDDEGVAKRTCVACGAEHFICDSEEYWGDAQPEEFKCIECGSKRANVGVGFSLHGGDEVRWLYVGERCAGCGVLGCFAGWKIAYSPSKHLMERA